jgi:hypothetical protein
LVFPEYVRMNKKNIGCVNHLRRLVLKFQDLWIYKVKLKGLIVTQCKWIIFQKVNKKLRFGLNDLVFAWKLEKGFLKLVKSTIILCHIILLYILYYVIEEISVKNLNYIKENMMKKDEKNFYDIEIFCITQLWKIVVWNTTFLVFIPRLKCHFSTPLWCRIRGVN